MRLLRNSTSHARCSGSGRGIEHRMQTAKAVGWGAARSTGSPTERGNARSGRPSAGLR
ncbi:hypothetical protein [Embleya sp. NPDC050493]|uniref:hypothetical protein n=1 Tax=Embleya sp. NPDC050493 TaxID=3363989 RepID=UPI0037ACED86